MAARGACDTASPVYASVGQDAGESRAILACLCSPLLFGDDASCMTDDRSISALTAWRAGSGTAAA